ncbi:D-alanyl-D-alanine carboxypeptidase/D-alanyl-D-alanine-endopeptidase [Corynebacterium choanae]|uniref:D-alanyl-D-alanine carboxypeptidase n=1 Tax=Corynebacterium choanae TaxID=1862358 RepID=A0A3G6J3V1_9CORY|nr:D-alanyl-D-alanine carboxypeptidase/D-alanyl-D-alanine-endopeptidase [Corynebacterium choanae]AZA12745.1 D-alanyl-D-alanine carboxypeptidase precursor [Corynebacterium choanae]
MLPGITLGKGDGVQRGYMAIVAAAVAAVVAVGGVAAATGQLDRPLVVDPPRTLPPLPELPAPATIPLDPGQKHALAAALQEAAADPALGNFTAAVVDANTGELLVGINPRAARPASVTKLLTAAAGLWTLGEQYRIPTTVVAGVTPGEVILRGFGDPTLNEQRLTMLARDVLQTVDGPITAVAVDTSTYSPVTIAPSWHAEDIPGGFIAPVEPLMVAGGRVDGQPTGDVPRSMTPALDAGNQFAAILAREAAAMDNMFSGNGEPPAVVDLAPVRLLTAEEAASLPAYQPTPTGEQSSGNTATSASGQRALADGDNLLAVSYAPPLREVLAVMLEDSDNVLAETVGRQVALAQGVTAPDSAAAAAAVRQALAAHGITSDDLVLVDTSGLSDDNRINPQLLADLLQHTTSDRRLDALTDGLPVAGATGTLAGRYLALPGAGFVHAKTGTLIGVSSLAGTVSNPAGNAFVFAAIAEDTNALDARPALDRFASILAQ